jgi:hypothetical protein
MPFPFTLTGRTENFLRARPDLDDTIKRLKAYIRSFKRFPPPFRSPLSSHEPARIDNRRANLAFSGSWRRGRPFKRHASTCINLLITLENIAFKALHPAPSCAYICLASIGRDIAWISSTEVLDADGQADGDEGRGAHPGG